MKILIAIKKGIINSLNLWKGVLIIWMTSLFMVSMVVLPMKGALNSALGKSMITEKLAEGINVEVFTDMVATLKSLTSYFSTGFLVAIMVGFILNTFFTGGLFNSLKGSAGRFNSSEFFRTSAKNFWSFLIILAVISLIIMFLIVLIIGIPMSIVSQIDGPSEGIQMKTFMITSSVFILLLTILLLVADYARAWQADEEKNRCFRAIGFGFKQTFRTFLSSYPLMIFILILQLLYLWLVMNVLPGITPSSGGGVLLLFLFTQLLFIIRIMLKVSRYGSVTALMEMKKMGAVPE
jgi:hypothetical protein